jgi:hypothetical protein
MLWARAVISPSPSTTSLLMIRHREGWISDTESTPDGPIPRLRMIESYQPRNQSPYSMFDATTIWPNSSSTVSEDVSTAIMYPLRIRGDIEFRSPLTRSDMVEAGLRHHSVGAASIASGSIGQDQIPCHFASQESPPNGKEENCDESLVLGRPFSFCASMPHW